VIPEKTNSPIQNLPKITHEHSTSQKPNAENQNLNLQIELH
jgi:hypothetical protein